MEEQTKAELTPTEKLKQEIADLQSKIKGYEQVIEADTTAIYWNKKRIKLMKGKVTIELSEYFDLKEKIDEQNKIINEYLKSGKTIVVRDQWLFSYKYTAINADQAIIDNNKSLEDKLKEHADLMDKVMDIKLPMFSWFNKVGDLFNHYDRIKMAKP